jgi:hypothetical protein
LKAAIDSQPANHHDWNRVGHVASHAT